MLKADAVFRSVMRNGIPLSNLRIARSFGSATIASYSYLQLKIRRLGGLL